MVCVLLLTQSVSLPFAVMSRINDAQRLVGQWGWFMVWENRELSQNKHWPSFLLGALQCLAESILFGFVQPVDKHLNDRSTMGFTRSLGCLKESWDMLADLVLFINREVIQTAVNFIKKPHFKVPEQAFLFTSGLSLSFIFASTPGILPEMLGAKLTFGWVFWLGLQKRIYL